MNQIPQEGEYCTGCPVCNIGPFFGVCLIYAEVLKDYKRLPICLTRKPRIVEEER